MLIRMSPIERTVGRYVLLDVVGRGATGTVYRARQKGLGRFVAVKELEPHAGNVQLARRFVQEARLTGELTHPNIVAIHDYFEHEGNAYIAMELLPHGSLRAHVGHLDLPQVGGVLEGILAALTYAAPKLVHRDIKPENVLVGTHGRVKLADFGVARAINASASDTLTAVGGLIGSVAYMSPEQAEGGELGPWTDLYAVGVVAYELLVGERPHPPAATPAEALARLLSVPIRPPLALCPTLDPGLATWLERMLRSDPAIRQRSPAVAWQELEGHLIRLCGALWRQQAALNLEPATPPSPQGDELAAAPVIGTTLVGLTARPGIARLVAITSALAVLAASLAGIAVVLGGR